MISWEDYRQGAIPFIKASKALGILAKSSGDQLRENIDPQTFVHALIPTIVMEAFSCELMLKALIAHERKTDVRGHRLTDLFTQLPKGMQTNISNCVIEKMKKGDIEYSLGDFETDLSESANLFVDWRYFFESSASGEMKSANLSFLHFLFVQLEEELVELT